MPSLATGVAMIAASATLGLAQPVFAQTPASTTTLAAPSPSHSARPDPLDTKALVPPVIYRSVFQGYRPNVDAELGSWKAANDTVGRVGGWRFYTKEAREPGADAADSPASGPATPPVATPPAGHAGHAGHKTN